MTLIQSLEMLPVQPPPNMVGRAALFNDLNRLLAPDQAVFLYGIAGMGKRALAATLAANRLQTWQPVLWLTAARDNLQTLANQVLRAYKVQATGNVDELVVNVLQQHTPTIIINGIASHEIAAQFIRKYADKRASVLVLHDTAADGPWETLLARRLDENASFQLFTEIIGDPQINAAEARRLLDYLNGHPLSLWLAGLSVAQGITTLAALRDKLPPPPDAPLDRALAVIEAVFHLLPPATGGLLLAMCANFSSGLSADLISRLLGTTAHPLCQTLLKCGFITQQRGRGALYYEAHPLVQAFAVGQLEKNDRLHEARQRMVEALVSFTKTHAAPNDERRRYLVLLEMDNILGAALYSVQSGQPEMLNSLLEALSGMEALINDWGYQSELARLRQLTAPPSLPEDTGPQNPTETIVVEPTDILPMDDETQPRKPKGLETALVTVEAPPPTTMALTTPRQRLQLAINEAAARHDRPEMARLTMQLAENHLSSGEIDAALDQFRLAVDLYQEIGDLRNLLAALEALSLNLHHHRGANAALDYARRGLNIAQQLGDDSASCRFLKALGDIYTTLGDSSNALEAFKRAIKLARALEDDETTGVMLAKLAALYIDAESYREATNALSQAIALFEQTGRRDLLGRSLGNLGTALGHLGRWREAGQRHAAALRIARELNDVEEERFQLENLAYVAEMEGHLQWAINYNRQALYLALLENDVMGIGELSFEIGRLLLGDPASLGQAVVMLEQAAAHQSQPETLRLLKEARVRLQRHERSGRSLAPIEPDLLTYAGEVYLGQA